MTTTKDPLDEPLSERELELVVDRRKPIRYEDAVRLVRMVRRGAREPIPEGDAPGQEGVQDGDGDGSADGRSAVGGRASRRRKRE